MSQLKEQPVEQRLKVEREAKRYLSELEAGMREGEP